MDGLPFFQGAQLAVDTTLVCPLFREGEAKPRTATTSGVCLKVARRRKEARFPELAGDGGRARLVVLAGEVGGRFSRETAQFPLWFGFNESAGRARAPARQSPRGVGGAQFCVAPQSGLLHSPSLTGIVLLEWMVPRCRDVILKQKRTAPMKIWNFHCRATVLCCLGCLLDAAQLLCIVLVEMVPKLLCRSEKLTYILAGPCAQPNCHTLFTIAAALLSSPFFALLLG